MAAACVCIALGSGCSAIPRKPKPPIAYSGIVVEMKTDHAIALPPSAENKALLLSVAARIKEFTVERLTDDGELIPRDTCTPTGLRMTVDIVSLTITNDTEVSGSILRPKTTSKSTHEILLAQRTRVQRCDTGKVLVSSNEDYEEKDIARVISKAAEDVASAAQKASREE